jgi:hypothetical protein
LTGVYIKLSGKNREVDNYMNERNSIIKTLIISLFIFSLILVGCSSKAANKNHETVKRDLTVALENTYGGPEENDKVMKINSITDSMYGPDLNSIFSVSNEIVRGKVKNIEYTNFTGLAWTKADILITESYKGVLKEGDLVSIFIYGGYMKLEDHIKYFNDRFRFKELNDAEIKKTVLKDNDNGKPFLEVGDDLFFPLVNPAPHMPFPEGSYENLSVAGILYIDKNGKFIQDFYDEGKKTTNIFTIDEVKNKMK